MRRYNDPIEVRSVAPSPDSPDISASFESGCEDDPESRITPPGSPQAFIWHGRLYVVRQVLAHWRERRAWWRDALDPVLDPSGQPAGPAGQAAASTGIGVASREQHLWRVEASPGQAFAVGVFDLTADDQDWHLVRVAD